MLKTCTDIGLLLLQMYTLSVHHDKTHIHFKHYDKLSFLSKKLLFLFSWIAKETRWREEDSLLPCTLSCLTLLFMIALWMLSAMCSLYPKQSREGQEFLDVQLFWKTICVSYKFIFRLYNYCYYNNYKDNWWTCMHISLMCVI